MLLSESLKLVKVADPSADGTSLVNGASVDMAADGGWDGVVFLTSFGTAAAGNAIHAETSDDDSTFNDLAGSEVNVGASDEDQFIDIVRPKERYLRAAALRGTSSTLGDIWALLYRGRTLPHNNVTAGTINGVQLVSPAEGTK